MSAIRMMERRISVPVVDADLHVKLLSHVAASADVSRPVIIFLHEALGSVGQWKSFPWELCTATGCDGIVYDRKGHGRSSPVHEARDHDFYRAEAEVYLEGLLQALNVRHPLLFGHSDGATIALKYAATFTEKTIAVVSEAAHVLIEQITVDGIREASRLYETTDLGEKLSRYHGEKTDTVFRAWADTWCAPEQADWDMFEDLRHITCPVLVVQGEDDQYGSRLQVDSIIENVSGPSTMLWLEGCGHVPHLQARATVIEQCTALINALPQMS